VSCITRGASYVGRLMLNVTATDMMHNTGIIPISNLRLLIFTLNAILSEVCGKEALFDVCDEGDKSIVDQSI
jgi:hypothetical protein